MKALEVLISRSQKESNFVDTINVEENYDAYITFWVKAQLYGYQIYQLFSSYHIKETIPTWVVLLV